MPLLPASLRPGPLFAEELRATIRLSAPIALANLLQMLVGAVDVVFVGRIGPDALAASALALSIFMLTMFSFGAVAGAIAPIIAAERGRKAHSVREIRRSLRMGLWLAVLGGAVGMAVCAGGGKFMALTGQDPALSAQAQRFLDVLSWAMLPMIVAGVLRSFVAAMGRPLIATGITALSIGVNALGNWAFIRGHLGMPALGLEGSAVATIVTSWAAVAAYAVVIVWHPRLRRYRAFGRWWRPEWRRLGEIVGIGTPIALTFVAEGGLFSSAAFLTGRLGADSLAAHTLALQVAALFFQVPFGIGQAATIRVGYHFGAGDADAIARAGRAALLVAMVIQVAGALLMWFAPHLLLAIYIDVDQPQNATLVALASAFIIIAAVFQVADGLQAVAAGMLRGLQDTRVPMALAILGYWLPGFGTAAWLGLATPMGGRGVWIGLAAGLFVVAVLLLWRWRIRGRLGLVSARRMALAAGLPHD